MDLVTEPVTPPDIELWYWPSCPSHEAARELLLRIMEELGLSADLLHIQTIVTDDDAQRENFPGSPTIRVNGSDIVASDETPSLTCRLYIRRNGRPSALPDPEDIRDALLRAIANES